MTAVASRLRRAAGGALLALGVVIGGLAALTGCGDREPKSMVPEEYRAWESTTEVELDYPIPGHEQNLRRTYINERGTEVETEARAGRVYWSYPEGTVIIKDNYPSLDPAPGETPMNQTVMVKRPDDPRSRGGWIWIVKDLKSREERIIDYEFCFDCHAVANESHPFGDENPDEEYRDYVFFPYRK